MGSCSGPTTCQPDNLGKSLTLAVMADLCQLGEAPIPRSTKYRSEWGCKGSFHMRLTFKSAEFELSRGLSRVWVGLIQTAEGLMRRKDWSPQRKKGILPADCLHTLAVTSTPPWVSSLPAYPAELGLANLHNHVSQVLKNPSPPAHTLLVPLLWREPWLIHWLSLSNVLTY